MAFVGNLSIHVGDKSAFLFFSSSTVNDEIFVPLTGRYSLQVFLLGLFLKDIFNLKHSYKKAVKAYLCYLCSKIKKGSAGLWPYFNGTLKGVLKHPRPMLKSTKGP